MATLLLVLVLAAWLLALADAAPGPGSRAPLLDGLRELDRLARLWSPGRPRS